MYDTGDRTYLNEHQKRRVNGVHFEAMREIKTIFRPNPYFYLSRAQKEGMVFEQIEPYINYLVGFHNGGWLEKIYLK
ncbi:hypothetical protein [Lonsdalea populi]|uniref:hypothetical protein n=1 Tax=Lonsdalea populi TaxID=1172565 RepID=UPI00111BD4B2|nr:hypothetical protein [Lonsdalea populi]QPQ23105.1 hypothetical protein I6N93_10510 [Lonsdalea populi]